MKENISGNDRRSFLIKAFSSCTLCCLAAPDLLGSDAKPTPSLSEEKHKFQSDSGMTIQQVFEFAFLHWYIPAMKNLMEEIGREKFLDMLTRSSDKIQSPGNTENINYQERTMKAFAESIKQGCENWKTRLTFKVIRENEDEFEIEFTECLWAKTFRKAKAADIGYAGCCYQDYGVTEAYHPNLELVREKTLMQGADCCHFKWRMKS